MALIVASVPEFTRRTFSTLGKASMISSANSFSPAVGSAKAGATADRFDQGLDDSRMRMSQDERAPRADVVEVAIAVDVEHVRTFAALDDDGFAPNRAERPGRAIHAARHELPWLAGTSCDSYREHT